MSPGYNTIIYLVHFDEPYRHAKHYMGSTLDLRSRLTDHAIGQGARLMEVIKEAGITWQLARVWQGDRRLERLLKNRKEAPKLCPVCSGEEAYGRARYPDLNQVTETVRILPVSHPLSAEDVKVYYENKRMNTPWLYREDDEERVMGEWFGELALELGLKGEIDWERFYHLIEGKDPDTGRQLIEDIDSRKYIKEYVEEVEPIEDRAGWDAIFSPPNSVTVLAQLSGDDQLRQGVWQDHIESVQGALKGMEKFASAIVEEDKWEQSGKIVASIHHHQQPRSDEIASPQVHTHAVILNMARGTDGRLHAMHEGELLNSRADGTAIYRSMLAEKLQKRGIEITLDPETGVPEVRRITQKYIEAVSPRSEDISLRETRIEVESLSKQWEDETAGFDKNQEIDVSVENFRAVLKTDRANPQAGVFYMNSHGMHFFQWLYEEAANIKFSHSLITTNREGFDIARQILVDNVDHFRSSGFTDEQIAGLEKIISTLDDVLKQNVETFSFINVDHPKPVRELAEAHEIFHGWQLLLEAKAGRPHISEDWVKQQPGFDKASQWLVAHDYPSDTQSIAREWAAYAATDDLRRMGFSRDETATFLKDYFDRIVVEHGVSVLDKIGRVSRDARGIINDLKVGLAAERQKGSQYGQDNGGTQGETGAPPQFQKIDLGEELDHRAGTDRRSAGEVLARGLGAAMPGGGGPSGVGERRGPIASAGIDSYPDAEGSKRSGIYPSADISQSSQGRSEPTQWLVAALQAIANIEAIDPSGRRSWRELNAAAGRIAREAIKQAEATESVKDRELVGALEKVAALEGVDRAGVRHSWRELTLTASEIARGVIEEAQSAPLAMTVAGKAADMSETALPGLRREPSQDQGISW
ncbi:MAG: relaxase domain-containing protein [Acidobacteria bacterium]|nr:relaxase domain-containing protein [Acidobacteriota bacterium]